MEPFCTESVFYFWALLSGSTFTCPNPGISHFFKELLFLLVGNGIRDQDLGAKYLHFSTLSADKLGHLHVYVHNMHINVCARTHIPMYVLCVHVDIYTYCRNCEFSYILQVLVYPDRFLSCLSPFHFYMCLLRQ